MPNIRFDPATGLWRDNDTGITGATQKDAFNAVLGIGNSFVVGATRQFSAPTKNVAAFSQTAKSGATMLPVPQINRSFGGQG